MARIVSKEESKLRLTADGSWQHEGAPTTHAGIKRYFHQQIRKDEQGAFYLYNAFVAPEKNLTLEEHVYFDVEDTAYFVESLKRERDAFGQIGAPGRRFFVRHVSLLAVSLGWMSPFLSRLPPSPQK